MLESQAMKAALSLWRWFLFLTVSWLVYNSPLPSFLIFSIAQDICQSFDANHAITTHLQGNRDAFYGLNQFFPGPSELLHPKIWPLAAGALFYWIVANALAAYLWLRKQTIMRAWLLAMAACFAGPYSREMFARSPLWTLGVCGCSLGYLLLFLANKLRLKKFPGLRLPHLLEWRKPGLVPPLSRFAPFHIFNKKLPLRNDQGHAPAIPRPCWPIFLLISWIIYSTATFAGALCALFLEDDDVLAVSVFVYGFLLDTLYSDDLLVFIAAILFYPMGGESPLAHAPLWLYLIAINGGAGYLWFHRQTIARAWLLAMAGCFAGPYTLVLLENPLLWLYGFMGACFFYCLLFAANMFLKKYFFAAP